MHIYIQIHILFIDKAFRESERFQSLLVGLDTGWKIAGFVTSMVFSWEWEAFSPFATPKVIWNKENWFKLSFLNQWTSCSNDVFEPISSTAKLLKSMNCPLLVPGPYFRSLSKKKWYLDNLRNLLTGLLIIFWEERWGLGWICLVKAP